MISTFLKKTEKQYQIIINFKDYTDTKEKEKLNFNIHDLSIAKQDCRSIKSPALNNKKRKLIIINGYHIGFQKRIST